MWASMPFWTTAIFRVIGQGLAARAFMSSDLHLESTQRAPSPLKGLNSNLEPQKCFSASCRWLVLCHESAPAQQPFSVSCAFNKRCVEPSGAVPTKNTAVSRRAGLVETRLYS